MNQDLVIEKKLQEILIAVKEKLSARDIQNIDDFISHGEWGVAYETLCVQIYEYKITITKIVYREIIDLGKSMGISPAYWEILKDLTA